VTHYLKKLKILLLLKILFLCISITLIIVKFLTFKTKPLSNKNEFIGEILDVKIKNEKITIKLNTDEKILINYYIKSNENYSNLKIGSIIKVEGKLDYPKKNTNFNLFNYKNYLLSEKIYFVLTANKITYIKDTDNIFFKAKNLLINYINNFKTKDYLYTFILGNTSLLEQDTKKSFQNNGISHLFAVSGMHITLISTLLMYLLKKITKNHDISYIITIFILLFYTFITNFSSSILRAFLLFLLIYINKKFKFNLKTIEIIMLILLILLMYNPFYIYSIGFKFTFIISIILILFSKKINNFKNYFSKLLMTSLISFFISLPIVINNFFEINLISPLLNLIFVPFISIIIFPFSLISLIFPFLDNTFYIIVKFMENISIYINNTLSINIIIGKMNLIMIVIYYLLTLICLNKVLVKKYIYVLPIITLILIYSNINYFNKNLIVTMLDVGQGDSLMIAFPNNKSNILIDTGGIVNFTKTNYEISTSTIIPYLKSIGIKKINYLVLTHGDYDHMGEAVNLVNGFKVEQVVFNCGEFNDLEKELIKVLNQKKIKYYSCVKELNIDNNKLYFLQTKKYDNENDNSNVIYTELNGYKFMFMGDAGVDKEKDILDKYNLSNVDVLKVGHHGSKTSSSKEFIDEINPKYGIISVGKNNIYGHPNKEVLNNLENSKIYRTDQDGSIMFKIKNDKLEIETCSP
jgi:DNA internalization competence protein ComEC/Rec2-like protein